MTGDTEASPLVAGKSRPRILVVDDEEAIRRMVVRLLTAAGYDVTAVGDGRLAMDLLANAAFDTILSDIDMPENDRHPAFANVQATRSRRAGHLVHGKSASEDGGASGDARRAAIPH